MESGPCRDRWISSGLSLPLIQPSCPCAASPRGSGCISTVKRGRWHFLMLIPRPGSSLFPLPHSLGRECSPGSGLGDPGSDSTPERSTVFSAQVMRFLYFLSFPFVTWESLCSSSDFLSNLWFPALSPWRLNSCNGSSPLHHKEQARYSELPRVVLGVLVFHPLCGPGRLQFC